MFLGSHAPVSCPTGWACPASNLSEFRDRCAPGYYCYMNATDVRPDGSDGTGWVCPAGHYCLEGTLYPEPCPNGTYSNSERNTNLSNCLSCDPKYFCSQNGLTAPDGNCSAGFYCPGGDTKGDSNPCDAGYFCPALSDFPQPCPSGTYQDEQARWDCKDCLEGRVCNASMGPVVFPSVICPEGHYCPNKTEYGEQYKCPKGKCCVIFKQGFSNK